MYNAKNYTAHGGAETVIGGKLTINGSLVISEGAEVVGLGAGKSAEAQADSSATTVAALRDDFNALLGKLRAAGIISDGNA